MNTFFKGLIFHILLWLSSCGLFIFILDWSQDVVMISTTISVMVSFISYLFKNYTT